MAERGLRNQTISHPFVIFASIAPILSYTRSANLRAFTLQIRRLCDTTMLLTNCIAETVQQKMVTAVANYQVFQSHLFFSVKICASFPNRP